MKNNTLWFLAGAVTLLLVLGLVVLLTLPSGPPRVVSITATNPGAHLVQIAQENELRFDTRYYDSIELAKRSPRTERELAIYKQLQRLRMAQPQHNNRGELVLIPKQRDDSIYEKDSGEPAVGFANRQQQLADIHRKIDSLKVLEHIPLTSY